MELLTAAPLSMPDIALASGGGGETLLIVALIIVLGVSSQVLADKFQIPSVLFLILAGVIVGPGLGIVTIDVFGTGALSTIVGLSVAIIVFEGAFHLKLEKIREAPSAAFRIVTIGAIIAFVGTTVAVRFLLGAQWGIAGLIGALLVATGPTVVTPILAVVPVRDRVGATLETEGIVNDVTAAIFAAVIFEILISEGSGTSEILTSFIERLSIGVFIGLVVAGVLWVLLVYIDLPMGWTPQNVRLVTFAGAIFAFSAANYLETEAGVAAVATAGIILGNAGLPYEEKLEEFKGDITLIVLSFVFIALAALIQPQELAKLGVGGLLVVAIVALVVRPLLVFLSTTGGQFTQNERVFMSFVGPRGIIPASVATLFALELRRIGSEETAGAPETLVANPIDSANLLVGTVFLVILMTVVFQGGFARQIGDKLKVTPMRVLIIGGGRVGTELSKRLDERGENIVILEQDGDAAEALRNEGFTVREEDGTDIENLTSAGIKRAKYVLAVTGDDDTNLLVAQLANSKFDVDKIIVRVNEPENEEAFNELDVETVSASNSTAWAIDNRIERPALSRWMTELGRSGDVQEIEVTDEDLVGETISELNDDLPEGCMIALVTRDQENTVPQPDHVVEYGDHITVIGRTEAVKQAITQLHPHD
jgi:NhaP-type Na+/H+ or K+/H+ antiporter/K+/H+ antiporter YhaU regulatory subunit KhtT